MNKITIQNGKLNVPDNVIIPFSQGDGVGAEIMPVCQKVINEALLKAYGTTKSIEWKELLAGDKAHQATGEWLPQATLDGFKEYLVGIKGPLTTPIGGGFRSLNVALRHTLDLYVCMRPIRYFPGVVSPVKDPAKVNMCVFRENTEDIYCGIEWPEGSPEAKKFEDFLINEMKVTQIRFPKTSAFGVKPVSIEGTDRLVRAAIRYAIENKQPNVTFVHKGNIMKYTEGGFKLWGYALAEKEFPNETFTMLQYDAIKKEKGEEAANAALKAAQDAKKIIIKDVLTDAFLQDTLLIPEQFSVIATMNLNGDYMSDMLAAMVGGIGMAPGANINKETGCAIFEATHGTAPDIAGKDIVNPCSLILSSVLMLNYLGWKEAGKLIEGAIEKSFANKTATHDLARFMPDGKSLGTKEFGDNLIAILKNS